MIDFSKYQFRCSSIGILMTNDRSGNSMGQTAKSELEKIYISVETGRDNEFSSKQIEKGNACEEAAITLLSLYHKKLFKKNEQRFENTQMTGHPDIIEGYDTKCSWSVFSFPRFDTVNESKYDFQNLGYAELLNLPEWRTSYCLVNATAKLIEKERNSIIWKMGGIEATNENYINKCIEAEKNMIFDMKLFKKENPEFELFCQNWKYDLPIEKRIKEFVTIRTEDKIKAIYERFQLCRKYLESLNYV